MASGVVCIKRPAAQWCPGRLSMQSFLSLDAFTWASLLLLSQALRAPLQMRRDGERWKPWERWAVGHRLQKLHGNFKGFLFLTPRLAMEYSAMSSRVVFKGGFVKEKKTTKTPQYRLLPRKRRWKTRPVVFAREMTLEMMRAWRTGAKHSTVITVRPWGVPLN